MSDPIRFEFSGENGEAIGAMFNRLADPDPALRSFAEGKRRRIILSMPRQPRGMAAEPGMPPASHSGNAGFAGRITYNVAGDNLEIGTYDVRGEILQFGGPIDAKPGSALTIPVNPAAFGKRASDFDLKLIPRKGKPALLVRENKPAAKGHVRGRMDVMFILLQHVVIKPHPYLAWEPEDETALLGELKHQFEAESA